MILFKLKKKYARGNIIFVENTDMDPDDKWFIDIRRVNGKGEKTLSTIIRKDIDTWKSYYISQGWIEID